jgi:hypothetical protein
MMEILFTKTNEGFNQTGEASFENGIFQWSKDGVWCGTGAVEPIKDLIARMQHDLSFYKYESYRIIEAPKARLVIIPCCSTCGLPGDISKPHTITEEDCDTGDESTFFGEFENGKCVRRAKLGDVVGCCRYHKRHPVDTHTTDEEARFDETKLKVNEWDQFIAKGVTGQFCSPTCLMQGMFTYGRCAGCAKRLAATKKFASWYATAEKWVFDKYTYCSPECQAKFSAFKNPLVVEHVEAVLSENLRRSDVVSRFIGGKPLKRHLCAWAGCGKGENLTRARVAVKGDCCSKECKKQVKAITQRHDASLRGQETLIS